MKFVICAFFLAAAVLGLVYPMDWPLANGLVSKNFGYNDNGRPVLGINFAANGQVKPAEQGELLFSSAGTASSLPGVLGSWVALDHGGGIIGIYGRMAPDNTEVPVLAEKSDILGQSGISGWSGEQGVYFSLFDRKERRWINPSILINPLPDSGLPVIQSVKLKDSGGSLINLGQTKTISQGRYTVLVEAAVQTRNRSLLAPFRITCSVNGAEIGRLGFDAYSARSGTLMAYRNGLVPVSQVYSSLSAFELGDAGFPRGQTTMEIIVQDAAGNSRNLIYRFAAE
ncbi:MAG: hypothetical protein FWD78_12050 [Treponema sp.]|nr:hypothetical protein [Treponema sp.]